MESARYANFLIRPLPPGPGVCQTCYGLANSGYSTCWPCQQAARTLGTGVADAVVPITLALKGEQYANELWRYKDVQGSERQYFRVGLAAVLWRLLAAHETCISSSCAVPRFDTVTKVPSTGEHTEHSLAAMAASMVGPIRDRYQDLLTPAPNAAASVVPPHQRGTSQPACGATASCSSTTPGPPATTPSRHPPR